jgi:hypothetical protein
MTFGAPRGGSSVPSRSALFRKLTSLITKHCSRAARPASIRAAFNHARVFLDHLIAGAAW